MLPWVFKTWFPIAQWQVCVGRTVSELFKITFHRKIKFKVMEDGRQSLSWLKWGADCTLFYFFKNGPTPASFLFIFGLFKQTLQILQQIDVKKCPSSIWCRDSNPRPWNISLFPQALEAPALISTYYATHFSKDYSRNGRSTWLGDWQRLPRKAIQSIKKIRYFWVVSTFFYF